MPTLPASDPLTIPEVCPVSGCVLPFGHWGYHQGGFYANPLNRNLLGKPGYPPPRPDQYMVPFEDK